MVHGVIIVEKPGFTKAVGTGVLVHGVLSAEKSCFSKAIIRRL
jgi:hypothetical protein